MREQREKKVLGYPCNLDKKSGFYLSVTDFGNSCTDFKSSLIFLVGCLN